MVDSPGPRSSRRALLAVAAAVAAVAVLGGVALAVARGSGEADRAARIDRVTTTTAPDDDATSGEDIGIPVSRSTTDGSLAFADGHWDFTLSSTYRQTGSVEGVATDSAGALAGSGSMDVNKGAVTGTFTASGPGAGTVSVPTQGTCASSGTYTLTGGTVGGTATAATMTFGLAFAGSVSCPDLSTSTDQAFPGTSTSKVVVLSASPELVVADWTVDLPNPGFDVELRSRMVATRNGCPANTRKLPTTFDRIRNGTAGAPTVVQLQVDPSIQGSPDLAARLDDAVNQWNANLAAAGRHIEFTTSVTDPAMPVVHVGVDNDATRATLPDVPDGTGKSMQRPVDATGWTQTYRWVDAQGRAWTAADDLPEGTMYTQEATVRLRSDGLAPKHSPRPGESWDTLARDEPQIVERVFLHELGHVLGLDDQSVDKDSPMYKDAGSLRDYHPTNIGCGDLVTLESF